MKRLLWLWLAAWGGGCAMMMPNVVALTQPPAADAFTGKGCAVAVAPVDVSGLLLDGQPWTDPQAPHALKVFKQRFLSGFTNVDPRNLNPGTSGPVVARPKLTQAVAGRYFTDMAAQPTEVWVTLEVQGASGELLERLESHVFVDATAKNAAFDDRLGEAGQMAGAALGKYLRHQLKCR